VTVLAELTKLDFAYGNLACTTRHAPSREAFAKLAAKRGIPDLDFAAWAKDKRWA
jgi:hypothetical protein